MRDNHMLEDNVRYEVCEQCGYEYNEVGFTKCDSCEVEHLTKEDYEEDYNVEVSND